MPPPNPVGSWADVLGIEKSGRPALGHSVALSSQGSEEGEAEVGTASALWAGVSHVLFLSSHFQGCPFSADEDELVRGGSVLGRGNMSLVCTCVCAHLTAG